MADLIFKKFEKSTSFSIDKNRLRPEKSEVERLVSNNEKIISKTNWKPKISLEKGLIKTFQWFEKIDIKSLYKSDQYNV